jgi:hypothetical protein
MALRRCSDVICSNFCRIRGGRSGGNASVARLGGTLSPVPLLAAASGVASNDRLSSRMTVG